MDVVVYWVGSFLGVLCCKCQSVVWLQNVMKYTVNRAVINAL